LSPGGSPTRWGFCVYELRCRRERVGEPVLWCEGEQRCIGTDLNTPRAMALTWELHGSRLPDPVKKATLLEFDRILGLGLADWAPIAERVPESVRQLVARREAARSGRRWADADELRQQIAGMGYELEDTAEGTVVHRDQGAARRPVSGKS